MMFGNPLRALLFAGGIIVAGGALAYVTGALDPLLPDDRAVVASLPQPQKEDRLPQKAAPKSDRPVGENSPQTLQNSDSTDVEPDGTGAETDAADAENGVVAPGFDLVRVEPDGSMVIAGHAAPEASVEIVTGSTVLGRTDAGTEGDFAFIMEDPLDPGDYQLVLRATAPGNVVSTSVETATVSVPDSPDGQVLVLVEAPGKPSELISVPTVMASAEDETANSTEEGRTAKSDDAQGDDTADNNATEGDVQNPPSEQVAAGESPSSEQMAAAENPGSDQPVSDGQAGGQSASEIAAADAANADDQPADAGPENPVQETSDEAQANSPMAQAESEKPDVASGDIASDENSTGEDASEEIAALEDAPAASSGSDAPVTADETDPDSDEMQASADANSDASQNAATETPGQVAGPRVIVEAVEIEGRKVFVAGMATTGRTVRVYANDILLGQSVASAGDRFLIEAERDLPVGDYIIRADLLAGDGATVLARAAVPFEREPGEAIAAVAATGGGSEAEANASSGQTPPTQPQTAASDTAADGAGATPDQAKADTGGQAGSAVSDQAEAMQPKPSAAPNSEMETAQADAAPNSDAAAPESEPKPDARAGPAAETATEMLRRQQAAASDSVDERPKTPAEHSGMTDGGETSKDGQNPAASTMARQQSASDSASTDEPQSASAPQAPKPAGKAEPASTPDIETGASQQSAASATTERPGNDDAGDAQMALADETGEGSGPAMRADSQADNHTDAPATEAEQNNAAANSANQTDAETAAPESDAKTADAQAMDSAAAEEDQVEDAASSEMAGAEMQTGKAAGPDAAAASLQTESGPASAGQSVELENEAPEEGVAIQADGNVANPSLVAPQTPVEVEPAAQAVAAAEPANKPAPATADNPAKASPEITAPKLQNVEGAVIIRRGDNLWRISRRVYGHGIRYTTIYLANQDQIRDPDLILPGQVFTVPRKSGEGELADMDAIADQATIVPAEKIQ